MALWEDYFWSLYALYSNGEYTNIIDAMLKIMPGLQQEENLKTHIM